MVSLSNHESSSYIERIGCNRIRQLYSLINIPVYAPEAFGIASQIKYRDKIPMTSKTYRL